MPIARPLDASSARPDQIAEAVTALERVAAEASPAALSGLLGALERLKAIAWERLVLLAATRGPAPPVRDPLEDLRQLTPAQVAELLSLKEPYVHELCRTGRLPAVKHGKYWLVSAAGLREWLVYPRRDIDPAPTTTVGCEDGARAPAAHSRRSLDIAAIRRRVRQAPERGATPERAGRHAPRGVRGAPASVPDRP
jgi:excisionase family DNA binding protein